MCKEDDAKREDFWNKNSNWLIPIIAIILCLIIWYFGMHLSFWLAQKHIAVDKANPDGYKALFGDSFGAVNALISAFAFAGVIVAIILQQKELKLQRDDLALQRDEFKVQNKTLRLQRFENTFFNMLSLQQEIVANLNYNYQKFERLARDLEAKSREVFKIMFEDARHEPIEYVKEDGELEVIPAADGIRERIQSNGVEAYFQISDVSIFDHYFRHLYRIIKFIHVSTILTQKEKYSYVAMLRATLSKYELIFLFYNSLHYSDFKQLIEEYSILKNLDTDSLAQIPFGEEPRGLYKDSAYDPTIKGYNILGEDKEE